MKEKVEQAYAYLFEQELIDEIVELGQLHQVKKGEVMMEVGSYIKSMPLLLDGAIKIMREDDDGDEMLLYFLERGDTCAMTLTCCLGNTKSEIRAVAERDTELLMIPVEKMGEWTQKYKSWMGFIFESYNTRMKEMLESIDSLAFLDMHDRIYKYLTDKVKIASSTTIENTHQEIAYDMHTSRVVVSRVLKQLEKESKIRLHRNRIEVLQF